KPAMTTARASATLALSSSDSLAGSPLTHWHSTGRLAGRAPGPITSSEVSSVSISGSRVTRGRGAARRPRTPSARVPYDKAPADLRAVGVTHPTGGVASRRDGAEEDPNV